MTSFKPICIHTPVFYPIPPRLAHLPFFLLPPRRVRLLSKQKARESTPFFLSSCCMGSWKDLESFSLLSHFIVFFSIFPFSPLPSLCFLLFSHCFGQCLCLDLIYSYYKCIFQCRMASNNTVMGVLNFEIQFYSFNVNFISYSATRSTMKNTILSHVSSL